MVFRLLSNSAISVLVKALGLVLVYALVYVHGADRTLGVAILYWGYVIFIQGALITPLAHFCVSVGNFQLIKRMLWLGGGLFLLAVLLNGYTFTPFIYLLAFMALNSLVDCRLIVLGRYELLSAMNGIKNIAALFALLLKMDVVSVFYFYAAGELVKFLLGISFAGGVFLVKGVGVNADHKKFFKYAAYLFLVSSYFVIVKTWLAYLDPSLVVEFEIFFRVSEVILVGVTGGVMPIYLNKMHHGVRREKWNVMVFSLVSVIASMVLAFIVSLVVDLNGLVQGYFRGVNVHHFYVSLCLALLLGGGMVVTAFLRKEFGVVVNALDLFKISVLPVVLIALLYLFGVLDISFSYAVAFTLLILLIALIAEVVYILMSFRSNRFSVGA